MQGEKRYHHGDLYNELLRLARETIEREGGDAISMRALAQKAGVSKAAPYRHFSSLTDLLGRVAAGALEELAVAMEEVVAQRLSGPQALNRLAWVYLSFARRRPKLFAFVFSRLSSALESPDCDLAGRRALKALESIVKRSWPTAPPAGWEALVTAEWAYIHGLSVLGLEGLIDLAPFEDPNHPMYELFGPRSVIFAACTDGGGAPSSPD